MPLLLLAGCSTDNDAAMSDSYKDKAERQKIHFTASVSSPVSGNNGVTRSWSDTYNNSLPSNAPLLVFLYAYDGSTYTTAKDIAKYMNEQGLLTRYTGEFHYKTEGEVDVASGRSALVQTYPTASDAKDGDAENAQPIFPMNLGNDGYVDAIAIFVPEGGNGTPAITEAGGTYTFTAPSDQTTRDAVVSADLLTNEVTSTMKSNASAINLDMRHRMCKVLVQFNPTENLTEENMPNSTYLMENVKTQLTLTLPSGDVTTTGSTGNVKAKVGEPFFIAPQTITAGTELLKFDLRNIGGSAAGIKNVKLKPTTNLEFHEGVYYVLNVSVGVRYINLTTTIKDWTGEEIPFNKITL